MFRHMFTGMILFVAAVMFSCGEDTVPQKQLPADTSKTTKTVMDTNVNKTEEDWKKELTPEQYYILRQKGTERPYTGAYWDNHKTGIYKCAGCKTVLFSSDQKFDSGCGWPSFSLPWDSTVVNYHRDTSHGMIRTEVTCKKCGGHLGHVFDDGPPPTYNRYCINSGALLFEEKK